MREKQQRIGYKPRSSRHTFSGHQHRTRSDKIVNTTVRGLGKKAELSLALAFAQAKKCTEAETTLVLMPGEGLRLMMSRWHSVTPRRDSAQIVGFALGPESRKPQHTRIPMMSRQPVLESLPAFPDDVFTDTAADTLVITRLRKGIDSENWVDQCAVALHEVQHSKKRHTAIPWEQKRLAIDSWAKEAAQGSMTAAHKHLKSIEVPPPLPSDIPGTATSDLTCTVRSSTDRRAEQWSQQWQRDKNQMEAIVESMKDIRTATVASYNPRCAPRCNTGYESPIRCMGPCPPCGPQPTKHGSASRSDQCQ